VIGREQVVLTALVDEAQVTVPLGVPVRKDDEILCRSRGGLVSVVVDADGD
jgi:hypothetical protein